MLDIKDKIAEAAKSLFSECGYDAVTTRDIAKKANVALSAIHYHFQSKENLLLQLVEKYRLEQGQTSFEILKNVTTIHEFYERLEIFAEQMILSCFADYPLFLLIQNEVERRNPILINLFEKPSKTRLRHLVIFFEKAQKDQLISADIDAEMAAIIIFRQIITAVRKDSWKTWTQKGSLNDHVFRTKWIKNLLKIVLHGIVSDNQSLFKISPHIYSELSS